MWAEPAVTLIGPRSARCNPLRWSRRRSFAALAEELTELQGNDRHRKRAVLVQMASGRLEYHDDVSKAIAALTRGRAKPTDWILVKKADATGNRWVYVPDLVKAFRAKRLGDIGEDDELSGNFEHDPLLRALDARSLEIVFASLEKSKSFASTSTRSSASSSPSSRSSSLASSMCSVGSKHHTSKPRMVSCVSASAGLEGHAKMCSDLLSESSTRDSPISKGGTA